MGEIAEDVAAADGVARGKTVDGDFAARWFQQAEQKTDEGGLATAVGTDQAQRSAGFNVKADLLEDQCLSVSEVEVGDGEDGGHRLLSQGRDSDATCSAAIPLAI